MFTVCQFVSAPFLDVDYNNTVNFTTLQKQTEFFNRYTKFINDDFDYQRKSQSTLKVGYSLEDLNLINYVILINQDGTKYFYFILNKEYVSNDVTVLYLKMDLIQTYMLRYHFKSCLVEREHLKTTELNDTIVKLNTDIINSVDEGLETGQYRLTDRTFLYNYLDNGCYIYTSSERLGISDEPRINITDDGNGGGSSDSSNYQSGFLDEKGLVFLKSKEGFVGSAYQDINGYWTIGYGITQAFQETYYNQLYPTCTEQQASEVMGEVVNNFSSQVKTHLESISKWNGWINQDKLNALTSFAYQNGVGGLLSSSIWQAIEEGKTDEEIRSIWISLGEYSERRIQEGNIFVGSYPTSMNITDHTNGGYVTTNNGKGYIPTEYQ